MNTTEFDFTPAPFDIPPKTFLSPNYFVLPCGSVFSDKKIPASFDVNPPMLSESFHYPCRYFVDLHNQIASYGTYNFAGARIPLKHSRLRVDKFRTLLPDSFEDLAILQYMEFGFPIGLNDNFVLQPLLKNHSSSYEYFTHIDKFLVRELSEHGLTGPFQSVPFESAMTSPLMTAVKKPCSRRPVFDASFGDFSLNVNTTEKSYLGENYEFSFPKIDDFVDIILSLGNGCFFVEKRPIKIHSTVAFGSF